MNDRKLDLVTVRLDVKNTFDRRSAAASLPHSARFPNSFAS
jgi:hypothetical protein